MICKYKSIRILVFLEGDAFVEFLGAFVVVEIPNVSLSLCLFARLKNNNTSLACTKKACVSLDKQALLFQRALKKSL